MKHSRRIRAGVGGRALAVILSASAAASPLAAQESTTAQVRTALEEAIKARAEAAEALRKAEAAIQAAQESLAALEARTGGTTVTTTPGTAARTAEATSPKKPEPSPYADRDKCGDPGTAGRILDSKQPVRVDGEGRPGGLNWFTAACLGLVKYEDFKSTTDVMAQFTGTKGDGVIEAGPIFTWRGRRLIDDNDPATPRKYRSTYKTLRVQGLAGLGSDGDAPVYNLDEFEFESGVGVKLGFEYGQGPIQEESVSRAAIDAALAQARRDCIARYSVTDPLNSNTGETSVGYRTFPAAAATCEGESFAREWLSGADRNLDYWKKIVRPLWGYDDKPAWFVGAQLSWAWSDFKYYPLYDIVTGNLLPGGLPAGFLAGEDETKDSKEPFAAMVYAGFSRPWTHPLLKGGSYGATLGLTYRREFIFPSKYKDQQICVVPAGAAFNQCRKVNTAAPYEAEGVVASLAMKFQLPHYGFLPPIAFTVKPSYAFDLDRWGLEVPLYLFNDSEGKLSSGIKLTCRGDGTTRSGFELGDECGAALFVGTKFQVGGAP